MLFHTPVLTDRVGRSRSLVHNETKAGFMWQRKGDEAHAHHREHEPGERGIDIASITDVIPDEHLCSSRDPTRRLSACTVVQDELNRDGSRRKVGMTHGLMPPTARHPGQRVSV
jgi:hypothetical protein